MIIEGIMNLLKLVINGILAIIPSMSSLALPDGLVSWFQGLVQASAYFLPMADFVIMFGIWMVVTNFSIIWKLVLRVWNAIPFTFK